MLNAAHIMISSFASTIIGFLLPRRNVGSHRATTALVVQLLFALSPFRFLPSHTLSLCHLILHVADNVCQRNAQPLLQVLLQIS